MGDTSSCAGYWGESGSSPEDLPSADDADSSLPRPKTEPYDDGDEDAPISLFSPCVVVVVFFLSLLVFSLYRHPYFQEL
jgi:hypothetical protein